LFFSFLMFCWSNLLSLRESTSRGACYFFLLFGPPKMKESPAAAPSG
jgi:hypothetical protein